MKIELKNTTLTFKSYYNYLSEENRNKYLLTDVIISGGSNHWETEANAMSWVIPCVAGQKFKIKANSTANNQSYAFLADATPNVGNIPTYANGFDKKVAVAKDSEIVAEAPDNAKFLFITGIGLSGNATPKYVVNVE